MLKKINEKNDGFTLVEVMVTIVILAIISVPLLGYFSNSAAYNEQAKIQQAATVAAQNTLEGLKAADYDITDSAAVCTADPTYSIKTAPGSTGEYTLTKQITVDDIAYTVDTKITPVKTVSNSNTGSTTNYRKYVIGTMDDSKDVMATETSKETAYAEQYYYDLIVTAAQQANTSLIPMTESQVARCLDRNIILNFSKDSSKSGNALVTVSYKYSFNSAKCSSIMGFAYPDGITASTASPAAKVVKSSSIDVSKMENIYIFYEPNEAGDSLSVLSNDNYVQTNAATSQLKLFLVAQSSVTRPATYRMNVSTSSMIESRFEGLYTNLTSSELVAPDFSKLSVTDSSTGNNGLVSYKDTSRMVDIEVSVVQTANASKTLASVSGAKNQDY